MELLSALTLLDPIALECEPQVVVCICGRRLAELLQSHAVPSAVPVRRVVGRIDNVTAFFVHAVVDTTLENCREDDRVPVSEFLRVFSKGWKQGQ